MIGNLTPEKLETAFRQLKAQGVAFPYQVALTWLNVTTTVIFNDDGTCHAAEPDLAAGNADATAGDTEGQAQE